MTEKIKGGCGSLKSRYMEKDRLLFIEITEEIDHHTTEEIRRKMDREMERCMPRKVIFDFSGVTFMDSAGIGLLLGRYRLAMLLGAKLNIIHAQNSIKKILEMSGILKIIPILEEVG